IGISFFYYKFPNEKTLLYFLIPNIIIGFIFHLLIKNKPRAKEGIFNLEVETDKGNRVLENFIRGVSIFGSSGSGKTQSGIYSFFKHFSKYEFSGVFYDYKNG